MGHNQESGTYDPQRPVFFGAARQHGSLPRLVNQPYPDDPGEAPWLFTSFFTRGYRLGPVKIIGPSTVFPTS